MADQPTPNTEPPRFSRGGFIPGPPIHATVHRLDYCVCGELTYSLDDGPPVHLIPAGTTFEAFRDWARRCPLLKAEEARAQAAVDEATTGTGHTYWVPGPLDPRRVTKADLGPCIDLGYVEGDFHPHKGDQ